jgi:hypothetical protein
MVGVIADQVDPARCKRPNQFVTSSTGASKMIVGSTRMSVRSELAT